jgi:hypothetical protein
VFHKARVYPIVLQSFYKLLKKQDPLTYGLLVYPLLFPTSPFNKSLMQDLEVYRRAAERRETEVPSTDKDIGKPVRKRLVVSLKRRRWIAFLTSQSKE